MSLQSQELETLEARIRATEERLKQQAPFVASNSMSSTALSAPNLQTPNGDLASLTSPPQQQRQETRKDDAMVTSVATSQPYTDPEQFVAAPAGPLDTS